MRIRKILSTIKMPIIAAIIIDIAILAMLLLQAFSSLKPEIAAETATPASLIFSLLFFVPWAVLVWAGYKVAKEINGNITEAGIGGTMVGMISWTLRIITILVIMLAIVALDGSNITRILKEYNEYVPIVAAITIIIVIIDFALTSTINFALGAFGGFLAKANLFANKNQFNSQIFTSQEIVSENSASGSGRIFQIVKFPLIVSIILAVISGTLSYVGGFLQNSGVAALGWLFAIPQFIIAIISLAVTVWAGYKVAKEINGNIIEAGIGGTMVGVISGAIGFMMATIIAAPTGTAWTTGVAMLSLIGTAIISFALGTLGGFIGKKGWGASTIRNQNHELYPDI